MSMLAGPRRRQKFTLNPRGKHWSEDPNKFGQKMLEKMGWSSGKGLGANEQGMTEHVRVRVKNDQVGIGYQKDKDDHWTEHQDDFNSFLQNLQKEQAGVLEEVDSIDKALSGKSLEEKSKLSQKRVHYKKFTRGKDVNKYSTKDLANIFGKKDLSEKTVVKQEVVEEDAEVVYDPIGAKDTTAGVLTVKGGNMDDYFKNKFNGISRVKQESDDECETRVGFGYSSKSMSKFYVNDDGEPKEQESDDESQKYVGFGFTKGSESKSKGKKRVDLNYVYDNPCLDLNILDDSPVPRKVVDLECSEKSTPKKRKSEFSFDNEGLDLNCPDRHTPKRRKSEHSYENKGMDLGCSQSQVTVKNEYSEDVYEITEESIESREKRKSKKSKKMKNEPLPSGIENPALDLNAPDRCTPRKSKVKSESVSPDSECSIKIEDSVSTKNKPRIIKCEIISNGFDNLGLDLNYSYKVTPKKTVEVEAYENPALDVSNGLTPKKNKKIESKDSSNAFDNPGLDENFSTPEKTKNENHVISNGICNPGLDLNFAEKPTPKKCKKIKEESVEFDGLENPGLDLEDKPTPKKPKRSKVSQALSSGLENPGMDLEFVDTTTPKKSKKNKHNLSVSSEFENLGLESNSFTNEVSNTMGYEVSRSSVGVENNALDLSDEKSSKRRVTFNDQLEYNTDITKKKKKKSKNTLDKYEVVTDKLKKKYKHVEPELTTAFVNEGLDLHIKDEEEIENEINERKSRKGKRRKGRRMSLLETIEEAPEEDNSNETPNTENGVVDDTGVVMNNIPCEDMCVDAVENAAEDVSSNKSKKKKKAKKDAAESIEGVEVHEVPTEKKKKRKAVKEEPMEVVEVDSPEKENKCTKKDKKKKTDDKKIKNKSTDDDVISLEEFLNEEEISKTKQKSKNQSADSEICRESEKIEEAVPKENNEHSYQRFKKTKQVMKSLFMRNPTLMFTGSNINEIKGYGYQFNNNY